MKKFGDALFDAGIFIFVLTAATFFTYFFLMVGGVLPFKDPPQWAGIGFAAAIPPLTVGGFIKLFTESPI